MNSHIFISHASKDDDFVKELRQLLEGFALTVWVDSRNLRGGDKLAAEIESAIATARQTIVVISPNTVNSPWMRREIQHALAVEKAQSDNGYRVIPVLLPGIEPSALALWFDEEPVGVKVQLTTGGLMEALPSILSALGLELPDDFQRPPEPERRPVAELKLKLKKPRIVEVETGKFRVSATAQLVYDPPDSTSAGAESREFDFVAPLGVIEADHLRWYLEEFYRWPCGVFTERARFVESQLPQWGAAIYQAATAAPSARELLADWQRATGNVERRFSVFVDSRMPENSSDDDERAANEAASALLSLPWELLNERDVYLFQDHHPVRVRRCLPKERSQNPPLTGLPIRILLVSPRPEDDRAPYINHRISALPLVEAVENLGQLVELTLLSPPTFQALQQALQQAADAGKPFDIIHFDGHGVFDRAHGLGALCFEAAEDADKVERRRSELVYAAPPKDAVAGAHKHLAELMRHHRVPLVFLEACQTAKTEDVPAASVATKLLEEGVTSVVAMTHSVLVETARRFVEAFYQSLAEGHRIGTAMLAGQRALYADSWRGLIPGAGELHLQDWFVPVLYQEPHDPQLITRLWPERIQQLQHQQRRLSLGNISREKDRMPHSFVGRSRDLLKLERMLLGKSEEWLHRYVVVRGRGGEGKTTIAVELAHWLTRTNRFDRAAFVSLEQYTDARGVLDEIGRQLLPEGENWSVANFRDLKEALQPVERALRERRTVIVVDNVESLFFSSTKPHEGARSEPLPPDNVSLQPETSPPENLREPSCDFVEEIFALCRNLLDAAAATRLIFTSREPLPEPFHHRHRVAELRELAPDDAIELVAEVMKRNGLEPKHDDAGNTPQEIAELVEAVGCHARALTLLARELAITGVYATMTNVRQLMAELECKHPGDRENSLYASVELSLRRLPPEMREQVNVLVVFHGGVQIGVLGMMLEADEETVQRLAAALIEVGLAEAMPYGHLRLDPALPNYLLAQTDAAELPTLTARWAAGMRALTRFLYQQQFQDAQLAAQLTLLELPNLLALLTVAADALPPEEVVDLAGKVEDLLAALGRPQALAQAVSVRAAAARRLGAWSHAQFQNADKNFDRMLEQGAMPEAFAAAQQLLARCQSAGADAYPGAAHDIATAYFNLGRVLLTGGAAEEALAPLAEARQRYQSLAEAGSANAAVAASAAINERAQCLSELGRDDDAAAAFEESIRCAEELGDRRGAAVAKANLGGVRSNQKRYAEALERYAEALKTFESLNELGSVATVWHQIGMIYKEAEQLEQAERAYRQSLAIKVQQKNRAGEANSLNELGNLYDQMGRLEEAVTFYRQAAEIDIKLQDLRNQGFARNNLANILVKLQRYDEARPELLRAIECKKPFGHAAQIWKTWDILHDLEQATGNAQAAAEAREKAVAAYLAYRCAGGESQANTAPLYALVAQALQDGTPEALTAAAAQLAAQAEPDDPARFTALLAKLQAVLRGDRSPALAADPALDYDDAVELQLLLEALGTAPPS